MKIVIMIWVLLFSVLSVINGVGAMISDNKIEVYHFQEMSAIYLVGIGIMYSVKCIIDEKETI